MQCKICYEVHVFEKSTDIFVVRGKIRGFIEKLILRKNNIEDHRYDSSETFIIENNANLLIA